MTIKEFFSREKHVALNAQPPLFRLIKWIVILLLAFFLYLWKGVVVVGELFGILCFLGISLHFFLRYKTKAWTQAWGPYKKIPLDDEK